MNEKPKYVCMHERLPAKILAAIVIAYLFFEAFVVIFQLIRWIFS